MTEEKEITVEVDVCLEELNKILKDNNFRIITDFILDDIYMIKDSCNLKKEVLDILKECVLLRSITEKEETVNCITYKYKEYNAAKEIIKQGKIDCYVDDINSAKSLLEAINYKELFRIKDYSIVYANDKTEFVVKLVDNHIYIEMEDNSETLNKEYNEIEDMKKELLQYNIPIKNNDFFVKKAEIALLEILNK